MLISMLRTVALIALNSNYHFHKESRAQRAQVGNHIVKSLTIVLAVQSGPYDHTKHDYIYFIIMNVANDCRALLSLKQVRKPQCQVFHPQNFFE